MGITSETSLGRSTRFYVKEEGTPGTYEKMSSAESLQILKAGISHKVNRKNHTTSYMPYRNITERRTGRAEASFNIEANYMPSGVKTTAPGCGPFLKALLGTETVGANDVTYSQSSSQTLSTLSMMAQVENLQRALWGCFVDEMTFKASGGEEPVITFGGKGMGYCETGYGVLDKAVGGSITGITDLGGAPNEVEATTSVAHELTTGDSVTVAGTTDYDGTYTITVTAAATFKFEHAYTMTKTGTWEANHFHVASDYYNAFEINSVVQLGSDSNGGAGFKVTAIPSSGVFTLDAYGTAVDAAAVVPFAPTWSPTGSVLAGTSGTLTFDNQSLVGPCTNFELSIKSGNKYVEDGAFEQYLSDAIVGIFEITGKIDVRLRKDHLLKILNRKTYTSVAVAMTMGGTAQSGTRLEISCPYCEQDWSDFEVPESEEVTVSIPFIAMDSSGNDALTWKHT